MHDVPESDYERAAVSAAKNIVMIELHDVVADANENAGPTDDGPVYDAIDLADIIVENLLKAGVRVPDTVTDPISLNQGRALGEDPTVSEPAGSGGDPIDVPEVWPHVLLRWPLSSRLTQLMKVAEEAGEANGAAIKRIEGRKTMRDVLDELADTIIAAIGALQAHDADPAATVARRWGEVSNR